MLAASWFERTFDIDFETWKQNMSNLREFTWSARVVQFLPLAGAVAVARRSVPAAGLLLGWLLGYVVVKGSASVATIESGSYWRLVMPALPAFALLAAAVPLLVPTFLRRMGSRLAPAPGRRPGMRTTVAAVVVLSVVPLAVLLVSTPKRAREVGSPPILLVASPIVDNIAVPAEGNGVELRVRATSAGNVLTWTDPTKRARTFYRVYRASETGGFRDVTCELRGVDRCELRAETLVTTRERQYVDPNPPPEPIYRVGVAANWLDETDRGDVFALSPPVTPGRAERVEPVPDGAALTPLFVLLCVFSEGGLITDSLWGDVGPLRGVRRGASSTATSRTGISPSSTHLSRSPHSSRPAARDVERHRTTCSSSSS